MLHHKKKFADIILLGRLHQAFTYQVPCSYASKDLIGHRAIVPLGQTIEAGIIIHTHTKVPMYKVRTLWALPDGMPILNRGQMDFLQWMAKYYLSSLAGVIQIALGAIRPFLAPKVRLAATYNPTLSYDESSQKLLNTLHRGAGFRYQQVKALLGKQVDSIALLSLLLKQKAITLADPLTTYLPRVKHLRLHPSYACAHELAKLKKLLIGKPKQQAVLAAYFKHIQFFSDQRVSVAKKNLQTAVSMYSLKSLLKKGIFVEDKKISFPFALPPAYVPDNSVYDHKVLMKIHDQWKLQKVVLLQGGSSSDLIKLTLQIVSQFLEKGQVLYLLPTIKQITLLHSYLKSLFGKHLGIYHAECTRVEKMVIWHAVEQGKLNFVIGTRSALFLPFKALRCIIVAEEHDEGYKQSLKSPYYHARDVAIVLARQCAAHILLSSVTPSLVSYHNAQKKRYALVVLNNKKRATPVHMALLPRKKNSFVTAYQLAPSLIKLLKERLKKGEQSIILHSRRGYAAYTLCKSCYWLPTCSNCRSNLTYHQTTHKLHCHHCNYTSLPPSQCGQCASPVLQYHSMGTQQVEELLRFYFPHTSVARLDSDIVHGNKNYVDVLAKFKAQKIAVLIATPALIKLLPIGPPCLIAILDIESWLSKPSFNAYEKTYQRLIRLTNATIATSLVLQKQFTSSIRLQVLIQAIFQKDHNKVYKQSLIECKNYGYPPYMRLVKVSLFHPHVKRLIQAAEHLFKTYQNYLNIAILGPTPCIQSATKGKYSTQIWLKLPKNSLLDKHKKQIVTLSNLLLLQPIYKKLSVIFDVDPL